MRFSENYIKSQITPDDYYHKDKNVRTFIIKGGQLYTGPAHEAHGLIAENYGISYGQGNDISGRVSKTDNVCAVWDYVGDSDPYSDMMADGLMKLHNNGLINSRTAIYITGSQIKGMPFASYLRNYNKKKQELETVGEFNAYAKKDDPITPPTKLE